ncbi:hypothetical protein [Sporosarcina ureae]|uniref:hypothetical protein n=1 Tax=Sporosarcina ureae TaxID=1571 RepID=UPI000A17B8F7|nr:hypothetical protein [Sporosarcina ureae]ARK20323.1 hypothetical protein SporoP32a_01430 [Sporosarcina ureae]
MNIDELKQLVTPLVYNRTTTMPYLRPFTLPQGFQIPVDIFLIGINPATLISPKDICVNCYVNLLYNEEKFNEFYSNLRSNDGKTSISRTRLGTSSLVDLLEKETKQKVLLTNVITYPTPRAKHLELLPKNEIDRATQLFLKVLYEHEPKTLITYGQSTIQNLVSVLNNAGLLSTVPPLKIKVREVEKSGIPVLRFKYKSGKEATVFACRHLMYYGKNGDSFKDFTKTVITHINDQWRKVEGISENKITLRIESKDSDYLLIVENQSNEDIINFTTYTTGFMSEDEHVFIVDYNTSVDILQSQESMIVEELTPLDLDYMTNYNVTGVVNGYWINHLFQNEKLRNTERSETESGEKVWCIPFIEKNSIPIGELIQVMFKDKYYTEPQILDSHYSQMVTNHPFTRLALDELYRLADYYYMGEGNDDQRKWDMAELLQQEYDVRFEQSEGSDILLAYCVAGLEYFGLTEDEMAKYFLTFD